ncbi:MAG: hypothetical protein V2J07_03170 [Anaerolineae bacterium]|jgi:hypothetical protein|nr:hypothetical protein [Anaerolineae bacterium]
MILLWMFSAAVVAFISILMHTIVTRWMDPNGPRKSMKRFWSVLLVRLAILALFFWQLVQQGLSVMIISLVIFLCVYAGSLYYIISKKPHWFQPEFKKDFPVWKP